MLICLSLAKIHVNLRLLRLKNLKILLDAKSAMRSRHVVDACAGAFSGLRINPDWSYYSCEAAKRAYHADVRRIPLTASYAECIAKDVPWRPGDDINDLV
jgi:hypothetical protein